MAAAAAAEDDAEAGLSEYERFRLANIRRNEAMLRTLGINVSGVSSLAAGSMAPTAATRRRRAVPRKGPRVDDGTERRSARFQGRDAPDYTEPELREGSGARGGGAAASAEEEGGAAAPAPATKRQKILHASRQEKPTSPKPVAPRSCKNLRADLDGLHTTHLGAIIPPLGGQVKRAAMEAASAEGPPSFSRMSGIQEWRNAVALFINVYGDGYKNAFLSGGAPPHPTPPQPLSALSLLAADAWGVLACCAGGFQVRR